MVDKSNAEAVSTAPELRNADQPNPFSLSAPLPAKPNRQTQRRQNRNNPAEELNQGTARSGKRTAETKADLVVKRLRGAKGVTIEAFIQTTGWQRPSVRGFLSGTVKKKLGLPLSSELGKDGVRRYRIVSAGAAT